MTWSNDEATDLGPDSDATTHTCRWEFGDDDVGPAGSVVRAVAAVTGNPPSQLRPLYEVIDPEALDDLFAPDGGERANPDAAVSFTYEGCAVSVHATGCTVVTLQKE